MPVYFSTSILSVQMIAMYYTESQNTVLNYNLVLGKTKHTKELKVTKNL